MFQRKRLVLAFDGNKVFCKFGGEYLPENLRTGWHEYKEFEEALGKWEAEATPFPDAIIDGKFYPSIAYSYVGKSV